LQPLQAESTGGDHSKMTKILIVEDDTKIATALAIRLKSEGYEVEIAVDAIMGVASARRLEPDLVILDISMPAGNGFTVAERLRALTQTMSTPFIFLTASKKPGLRERALEVGAVAFLEKPYDPEKLMATVREALVENWFV
jgi:DNA-binding response OmpR family regulator